MLSPSVCKARFYDNCYFHFTGHMATKMAIVVCVIGLVLVSPVLPAYTKPHIIMVVADDLVSLL